MRVILKCGDITDKRVDAIILSTNPHLRLSGVGGSILLKGGESVQHELDAYLTKSGRKWVEPGTVVTTSGGPLTVRHLIHAVAIDGFYQTSIERLCETIVNSFAACASVRAKQVSMSALATGYGRFPMVEFAKALMKGLDISLPAIDKLRIVVRHLNEVEILREMLAPLHPFVESATR